MDKKQKKAGMNGDTLLLSQNSPFSVQEAYKSLRTNVAFSIEAAIQNVSGSQAPTGATVKAPLPLIWLFLLRKSAKKRFWWIAICAFPRLLISWE